MELVAIDLEGSGAQDRDNEAILEIALVPIIGWQPDTGGAYCTLVNPQRPIPRRPWISPGLIDETLRKHPRLRTSNLNSLEGSTESTSSATTSVSIGDCSTAAVRPSSRPV